MGKVRGMGDVVANIAKATGIDKVAKFFEEKTGKDCGCKGRQEKMNNYPNIVNEALRRRADKLSNQ
jgi:hypothetical protein